MGTLEAFSRKGVILDSAGDPREDFRSATRGSERTIMGRMPAKWAASQAAFAGKITTFARNSYHQVPGFSQEDMEQELLEVLWWCTFDYDPNRGATFNTFVQTSFKNRIGTLIKHANAQKRAAEWVSLDIEAVAAVVEQGNPIMSAEDIGMFRIMLSEEPLRSALRQELA